ncbi:MAG: zinc-binding alcohol dehydrogenase [Euzebyales bacterium]|nr:zinc-binding alcohol dehydrogenase [Euzebyales bacterium]
MDLGEPGAGEALVQTVCSGISSGTEMLAYRGQIDPDLPLDASFDFGGTFSYPFRYGYSCIGQTGDGVMVFGFHPHQDRFVAREDELLHVSGVAPEVATLFPLVETALQITLDAGPRLGERVAVTGLGTVGLLVALLLQRAGADVVASDPSAWRRSLATSLGVAAVPPDGLDGPFALLVEVSGNPDALAGGLHLLAHEGTALVASWYGRQEARLPLGRDFHRRRLTIRSTQVSTIPAALSGRWDVARRRAAALRLLGELPLDRLPTRAFRFEQAAEAFAAVDRGDEGLLHAVLCYS